MSFKIPFFQPRATVESMHEWFRDFMGRWSGSDLIKARVVPIVIWDMVSTSSVTLDIGSDISLNQIVGIQVSIVNDSQDKRYDPSLVSDSFDEARVEGTDVILARKTGGFFDDANFSGATTSRGDVVICYMT